MRRAAVKILSAGSDDKVTCDVSFPARIFYYTSYQLPRSWKMRLWHASSIGGAVVVVVYLSSNPLKRIFGSQQY